MRLTSTLTAFLLLLGLTAFGLFLGACDDDDDDNDDVSDDDVGDDDAGDDDTGDDDTGDDDTGDDDTGDDDTGDDDTGDDDTGDDDDDDTTPSILFNDSFDGNDFADNWTVVYSTGTYTVTEAANWLTLTGEYDDGGNVWLASNQLYNDVTVALDCTFQMPGYGRSGMGFWVDANNWLTLTIGTDLNAGYWLGGAWNGVEAWDKGPLTPAETYPSNETHTATIIKNESYYTFFIDGVLIESVTGGEGWWIFNAYNLVLYTRSDDGASGDAQVLFDSCTLYADAE